MKRSPAIVCASFPKSGSRRPPTTKPQPADALRHRKFYLQGITFPEASLQVPVCCTPDALVTVVEP